ITTLMSELRGDSQELSPTAQRNETERRIRKARFDKLRALRLCKLMSEVKSMVQRLSHVTIHVLDQDSAYDFYINKLGFEVRTDSKMDNGFRWLTVGPKTQPDLEIVLMPTGAGPMMDEETSTMLRTLIRKGALGSGVLETADCQKTYEE